ncbi:uncharacterized protein LOC135377772 [Ornithodoros turicata]|uniref:uncharacterized protein LOC135377772 n=1 Tax=Ornithodoros turicata TaxID=34597 RepID=UPI00313A20E7
MLSPSFKRASRDLKRFWTDIRSDEVANYFSRTHIHWKFIAERAVWWGGFWERMVRFVKTALCKVLGKNSLTLDQLTTLLIEVEAMVNSRSISFVYSDSNEPESLSASHLLVGKLITRLPDQPTVTSEPGQPLLARILRYREVLLRRIWKRWVHGYLFELRTAHHQRPATSTGLKVNDLVLVKDDKLPRQMWKICRVVKLFPGRDGRVRSCQVQLPGGGTTKRAVQHLFPLEIV